MIYKINVTVDAERDLDDIYNYIIEHFLSPQSAQKTLQTILFSIHHIAQFPKIGIDVSHRLNNFQNVRMTISGKYLIFYRYQSNTIDILRILYQKRDWLTLFQ